MKYIPVITLIISLLTLWLVWDMSNARAVPNIGDAFSVEIEGIN